MTTIFVFCLITGSQPVTFSDLVFQHITTETFTDRTEEIGWIEFASCTEGYGSNQNALQYPAGWTKEEMIDIARYAITVKILPSSDTPGNNENTEYAVTADICSNPLFALNNGYELSFTVDISTLVVTGPTNLNYWIGSENAKNRLTNSLPDAYALPRFISDGYFYHASGNKLGLHIYISDTKGIHCNYDYEDVTGNDITIWIGFNVNKLNTCTLPTTEPSSYPTTDPTVSPITMKPTDYPTLNPLTTKPSAHPSAGPSSNPSAGPSVNPSSGPSSSPSAHPSLNPTTAAFGEEEVSDIFTTINNKQGSGNDAIAKRNIQWAIIISVAVSVTLLLCICALLFCIIRLIAPNDEKHKKERTEDSIDSKSVDEKHVDTFGKDIDLTTNKGGNIELGEGEFVVRGDDEESIKPVDAEHVDIFKKDKNIDLTTNKGDNIELEEGEFVVREDDENSVVIINGTQYL